MPELTAVSMTRLPSMKTAKCSVIAKSCMSTACCRGTATEPSSFPAASARPNVQYGAVTALAPK